MGNSSYGKKFYSKYVIFGQYHTIPNLLESMDWVINIQLKNKPIVIKIEQMRAHKTHISDPPGACCSGVRKFVTPGSTEHLLHKPHPPYTTNTGTHRTST